MRLQVSEFELLRMMTKVSHLYHNQRMVQSEIAITLGLSQAKVSRLLAAAEQANIVRTVVVPPQGLYSNLEETLEKKFGLDQIHIVDTVGFTESEGRDAVGRSLANIFDFLTSKAKVVGFSFSSYLMQSFVTELNSFQNTKVEKVVELVGGHGNPQSQHEANAFTVTLASLLGAEPILMRVGAVAHSSKLKNLLMENQNFLDDALHVHNAIDLALVEIRAFDLPDDLHEFNDFYSRQQLQIYKHHGAVGEIALRFFNCNGEKVLAESDDLVFGITLDQFNKVERRVGVSSGKRNWHATLAALRGKFVNILVTDKETAEFLISEG